MQEIEQNLSTNFIKNLIDSPPAPEPTPIHHELIIDCSTLDDHHNNSIDDETDENTIRLRVICKSSYMDSDAIIDSLHDISEKLNKNLINDHFFNDTYILDNNLTNRFVNCTEWYDGINPWTFTHPYPYFINFSGTTSITTQSTTGKRRNTRRYEIEYDEKLGLYLPLTNEQLLQASSQQTAQQIQNLTSEQIATAIATQNNHHYMKELNRMVNNRTVNYTLNNFPNVVYDRSIERMHSDNLKNGQHYSYHTQQSGGTTSAVVATNGVTTTALSELNKKFYRENSGLAQIQIYPFSSFINELNNSTQKSALAVASSIDNDPYKNMRQKEKTSLSDLNSTNQNSSQIDEQQKILQQLTQDKFYKIRTTFNAILNRNKQNDSKTAKKVELSNARLNVEDLSMFDESEVQNNYLSTANYLNLPQSNQRNLKLFKPEPIINFNKNISTSQMNVRYDGSGSNSNGNHTSCKTSHNLILDGDSILNNDSKGSRRIDDRSIRNKPPLSQPPPMTDRQSNSTYKSIDTTKYKPNSTNNMQLVSTNQQAIDSILPPIISGKRINLPHGSHSMLQWMSLVKNFMTRLSRKLPKPGWKIKFSI